MHYPLTRNLGNMEELDKRGDMDQNDREEIYSKIVRAGKRTYFFDVKATRKDDYYLTITESKKIFDKEGRFHFEKHKLFLYKEDFEKFADGFTDAVDYIKKVKGDFSEHLPSDSARSEDDTFINVEFEDLDGEK